MCFPLGPSLGARGHNRGEMGHPQLARLLHNPQIPNSIRRLGTVCAHRGHVHSLEWGRGGSVPAAPGRGQKSRRLHERYVSPPQFFSDPLALGFIGNVVDWGCVVAGYRLSRFVLSAALKVEALTITEICKGHSLGRTRG